MYTDDVAFALAGGGSEAKTPYETEYLINLSAKFDVYPSEITFTYRDLSFYVRLSSAMMHLMNKAPQMLEMTS